MELRKKDFEILQKIDNFEPTGTLQLAKFIGIAPNNLRVHLKRLLDRELIKMEETREPNKVGGTKRKYTLTPVAKKIIDLNSELGKYLRIIEEKAGKNGENLANDRDRNNAKRLLKRANDFRASIGAQN